jgi:phosphatidylserine/phosphatidylglycerophosphate/cardiolipin synthase-like enzyme
MKSSDRSFVRRGDLCVGGAELLLEFLDLAGRLEICQLDIIAPYVDDRAFADVALRQAWGRAISRAPTTIVVRTSEAARAARRTIERASRPAEVRLNERLHTKLYLARGRGMAIALCGSLNFTGAALRANLELGVLLRCAPGSPHEGIARDLGQIADRIKRDSSALESKFHSFARRSPRQRIAALPAKAHSSAVDSANSPTHEIQRNSLQWHDSCTPAAGTRYSRTSP